MSALCEHFRVSVLCKIAGISRSGYYKYRNKEYSIDQTESIVKEIFFEHNAKYGSRTISMEVKEKYGITINRKKVQKIMRKLNLVCSVRKHRPSSSNNLKEQYITENILNRQFKEQEVGKVACTDITYLNYNNNNNTCYLVAFIEPKCGRILEFQLSKTLDRRFVLECTERLLSQYIDLKMIHGDRGSQFTSKDFHDLLNKHKIVLSMSAPGSPLDNAVIESFWGHMKDIVSFKDCKTFEEVVDVVDRYMYDYNNKPQWNKGKLSPIQFNNLLLKVA